MLLMVEKGIRGGMCHAIHRHTKANNKYIQDYDTNKELSHLICWYVNNLYGQAIFQKLSMEGFKWRKGKFTFDEEHCEVDVNNPKKLNELHSDLRFLPKRMKNGKCQKLDCNLYNKRGYVIHIKTLNQAINHGLIDNIIIEFYKNA